MDVEPSIFMAVFYGVLSAVCLCLGKGFQKYGVEFIASPRKTLRERKYFKTFMWLLGTGGIVASGLLLFTACAYGAVSLIAALSGTGLIALALFSAFVLKERIGKSEVAGLLAIIVGTALVGYFDGWEGVTNYSLPGDPGEKIHVARLVAFSLVIVGLSVGSAAWSIRGNFRFFGVIFGSISGFCGGISLFFQKGAMLHCGCTDIFDDIPAALANPYFYLFAVTGIGDFLVTQYALTRSKAVTVVPCYQSWYMLLPVVGGIVAYSERFNVVQSGGVILLGVGVVLLSLFVAKGE